MLRSKQTKGFALLRKPLGLVEAYNTSKIAKDNKSFLRLLRGAVSFVDPRHYRGISREPLASYVCFENSVLRNFSLSSLDKDHEKAARTRFDEIHKSLKVNNSEQDYDDDLLPDLDQAREIYGLLDSANVYEIVELSREPFSSKFAVLGFDIGYWGGDHFSLICDTIVMPRWHPPVLEDLDELAEEFHSLNKHVLFSDIEEAVKFKKYYISKSWTEVESKPGEFCIIQIAVPKV